MANLSGLSDAQLEAEIAKAQASLSQPPQSASPTSPQPFATSPSGAIELFLGGDEKAPPGQPPSQPPLTGLSDAELSQQIRAAQNSAPMGTGEDMARSAVSGVEQGLAGVIGQFADIGKLQAAGIDWGAKKLTGKNLDPKTRQMVEILARGLMPSGMGMRPTSTEMNGVAQALLGPYHEPQTTAGKFTRAIGQFAPGAAMPGGVAGRIGNVVLPALGSEGAGLAAEQMKLGKTGQAVARGVGGLVGGGIAGAGQALASSPQRVAGAAIRGAGDADITSAGLLMQQAEQMGAPITWAEAMQQVTNNATGAGRLQRVIEGTREGAETIAPMMSRRPDQARQAVMNFADQVAPPIEGPGMLGQNAKASAQGALDNVRRDINARAQPHYDALGGEMQPANPSRVSTAATYSGQPGQFIPNEQFAALTSNTAYQQALKEVRGDKLLNAGVAKLPDNDLSVVNEVVKQLDRNIEAHAQTATNPSGNNAISGLFSSARRQADELASSVSPDWRAARDIGRTGRREELLPLESGPAGAIAKTPDLKAQTGALYPPAPVEGAPAETAAALRAMKSGEQGVAAEAGLPLPHEPQIGRSLTRQHLVNSFNEAGQNLVGGQNQYGGAKWAAQIAGNPEQAATLRAGLGEVAPNADIDPLLQVMMAQGKRQQPGSMTAFNAEDLKGLGQLPVPSPGMANPTAWPRMARDALSAHQYRRNAEQLGQSLLMEAEEAPAWLRNARPGTDQALLRALLLGGGVGAGVSQ